MRREAGKDYGAVRERGALLRLTAILRRMKPFWEEKSLAEMSRPEWESLCDGCGRCCVYVIHDEETGEVFETDVACGLFDPKKRRCTDYKNRTRRAGLRSSDREDRAGVLVAPADLRLPAAF